MENTPLKSTPKDVFLHLFNIVTFYLSVIGFITLYIQYINATFPDPLNYYFTVISDSVRVSTSILFIAVPSYLFTSWLLAKDIAITPAKKELRLRKWLVYFTLFISAITIIIDLMIFVYNFLNGELTVQFFLKVLVVLLVAAAVFGYYMWDLKRALLQSKIPTMLAGVVSVVVIISIILGFFIIGTPTNQRDRRFDDQRVQNLQSLQQQIVDFWVKTEVLPPDLKSLENDISGFYVPTDPNTKQAYEYKVIDKLTFELCANFSTSNKNDKSFPITTAPQMYPNDFFQQNWNHEATHTCFNRKIDPALYKMPTPTTSPATVPVK